MRTITFLSVFLFWFSCNNNKPFKTGFEGTVLPDATFRMIDTARSFSIADIPSASPVVLFFFSPRCPYCKAELDMMLDDMDKLNDIRFIMLSGFPIPELQNFYAEYKLDRFKNITVAFDPGQLFAQYFKVHSVPFTAIYGRNKKLEAAYLGIVTPNDIQKFYR